MKFLTVGTSKITHQFIDATKQIDDIEFVSCYSREISKAIEFSKQYKTIKCFDNYEEALESGIDFVYIASVNGAHAKQVEIALKKGISVICEKPMTLTVLDFRYLKELAKENNCFLFEAITTLHVPGLNKIKDYMKCIGKIHLVKYDLSQLSERYFSLLKGDVPNVFIDSLGGGSLYDLGVYPLHLLIETFGFPKEIVGYNNHYKKMVTSGMILCKYKDLIANITYGKDCNGDGKSLIMGEEGFIEIFGSIGRLNNIILKNNKGEVLDRYVDNVNNHMIYEIEHFKWIMEEKNILKCEELLKNTELVLEIVERLRYV